jgi:hypothetical protein
LLTGIRSYGTVYGHCAIPFINIWIIAKRKHSDVLKYKKLLVAAVLHRAGYIENLMHFFAIWPMWGGIMVIAKIYLLNINGAINLGRPIGTIRG